MMQWPFVLAAYAIVIVATLALVFHSYVAMRRAEMAADELKDRR